MESVLAAEFHAETGLHVAGEQTWCTHSDWEPARCTVDGFVVAPADAIEAQHLDLAGMTHVWEAKTDARRGWDEIPPHILAQARWNMGVTGVHGCWITVMFAGFRIEHHEVTWDESDWAYMLDAAQQFWTTHVEAGIPPEIDGSDATTRALKAVYPETVKGRAVEIDSLADELSRLEEYKALESAATKLAEAAGCIENRIKAAMGDAEIATVGGAPVYTLRTTTRKALVQAETTYRTLRKATKKDQEAA
jgi:predicted phage-related endonuclease